MTAYDGERTMPVIAHRISTLKDADRIVVFDRGRLGEEGDFATLAEDPNSHWAHVRDSVRHSGHLTCIICSWRDQTGADERGYGEDPRASRGCHLRRGAHL
jgi:energy-coupling factor transporter ATP-binding protein EcfA2